MSLHPQVPTDIPSNTIEVAHAAFPKGNPYMLIRDELGTIYDDKQFHKLYAVRGQPGLSPWRLAWVTVMQYAENLTDRQAADAVRARIDWKYVRTFASKPSPEQVSEGFGVLPAEIHTTSHRPVHRASY